MVDSADLDLLVLDREVIRGEASLRRWRLDLARDTEVAEVPFEGVRRVASRSMWTALGELKPSASDAPLRDALRQWVVALTQARIGAPAELARARAAFVQRVRVDGDPPRSVGWAEAWRGVVSAPRVAEAGLSLEAAATTAPEVAAAERAGASRRLEVARRFGFEHPWSALVSCDAPTLRAAARRLLDATDAIAFEVWRPTWRLDGPGIASTLHRAVGREAGEGWPARVTSRWIEDVFAPGATRGLVVDTGPLPAALGSTSFARALGAFGRAVRSGGGSRLPFVLAREPAFVAAHRLGFVFAALTTDPEWHARALGLGQRPSASQARILARSALLEARLHAARVLLGDDAAFALADVFEEIGSRVFGAALDGRLRGAWPVARPDEPARLIALLQSLDTSRALRERFDVDWFRNPRAWDHLRAVAAGPAREVLDPALLEGQAVALGRAFEEALG